MTYFFRIAYHGKNYSGWQTQLHGVGVQAVVEDALSKIFREPITIVGSGRTDKGVHCETQYFHAVITKTFDRTSLLQRLNSFLPKDIVLLDVFPVANDAHARYSAVSRTYHYRITLKKNPFLKGLAWHYFKTLDVQTMNEAAALLTGTHDFQCFSKVKTNVNNFICEIMSAKWEIENDRLTFKITANRFLRGMVRAIVGTLTDIGTGKISMNDLQNIIQSRDRKMAGANVPAEGLYLVDVKYPDSIYNNANLNS